MNKIFLGVFCFVVATITSFFIDIPVYADDVVTSIEVITSIEVVTDTEVVKVYEIVDSSVSESESVSVSLPETLDNYNYALSHVIDTLHMTIDDVADSHDIVIDYPDDFDFDVSLVLGFVMYDDYGSDHPDLYRDSFVDYVLYLLDIVPVSEDDIIYNDFYDALVIFYDDITGLSAVADTAALSYISMSAILIVSVTGFIKWLY